MRRQRHELKDMDGWTCWIGVDIGGVDDLTGLGGIFENPDTGKLYVYGNGYLPEYKLRKKEGSKAREDKETIRRDTGKYREWQKAGWLKVTTGRIASNKYILEDLRWIFDNCDVRFCGYDPRDAHTIISSLENDYGEDMLIKIPNTPQFFDRALDDFMKHVIGQKINHGGNPLLTWCFQNLKVVENSDGEKKLMKKATSERIDVAVAVLLAWVCRFSDPERGEN